MSTQLFDEILENNQLIKGRLNHKEADLEKLYRALIKMKPTQAKIRRGISKEKKILYH